MPIPSNVILIWPSTNASIPGGWVRETALDDKFPKGHGVEDPNITGGSNTHTHQSSHSHGVNAHHHTYVTGDSNEWTGGDYSGSNADGSESILAAKHTHQSATNTTTSMVGGELQSNTVSWQSANNEPPYFKVIFIKPAGSSASLSQGIVCHFNGSDLPAGWKYCDGDNSTPDMTDRYLKGAGTGADGGTTSGSLTHGHNIGHGHTANSHYHYGNTQNNTNPHGSRQSQSPSSNHATTSHYHLTTLSQVTDTVANYSNTTAGNTDNVEPAYKKMGVIQNKTAPPIYKIGMIGLFLGDPEDVPSGWQLCDGSNGTIDMRNKFIKIPASLDDNGDIGGSNTHNHSPVSHTHISNGSHTHTGSTGGALVQRERRGANGGAGIVLAYDTHPISSVSSVTPTYTNSDITADTVDNQPAYRTVAYIQAVRNEAGGIGAFFM